MGLSWSDIVVNGFSASNTNPRREIDGLKTSLVDLIQLLSPQEILQLAVNEDEVFNLCKENAELRKVCILAAFRKFLDERDFKPDVRDRSARYVVILDALTKIQEEINKKAAQEALEKPILMGNVPIRFPYCRGQGTSGSCENPNKDHTDKKQEE